MKWRYGMKKTDNDAIIYKYCGEDLGIPGLPHEISREEARKQGVEALLDQAIEAGVYQPKE